MEIKINSWWFSIWDLFVHDAHVIGPLYEDKIQECINEELSGTGYVVMCPEDSCRRAWHLYTVEGFCVPIAAYTAFVAEAVIKKLAPAAHEALAEIDTQTFSV